MMLKEMLQIPKKIGFLLIRIYQKLFSTDHAFWAHPEVFSICLYYPSCSQYTYEAIERFGLVKGSIMGLARIIRCNPWAKGGYDPVPDKFSLVRNKVSHG